MAALNRAAAGTIAGGVVGGLVDLSIPEYEAKAYEDGIKKGIPVPERLGIGHILLLTHLMVTGLLTWVSRFFTDAIPESRTRRVYILKPFRVFSGAFFALSASWPCSAHSGLSFSPECEVKGISEPQKSGWRQQVALEAGLN
jgi:hypothetical protein